LLYRIFQGAVAEYPHFRMSEAIKAALELGGGLALFFLLCLRFLPVGEQVLEQNPKREKGGALWVSLLTFLVSGALAIAFWRMFSWLYFWAFIIPVFTLLATAAALVLSLLRWRRVREAAGTLLPGFVCGLVALASWMQYYPLFDHRHVFWAVSPGIGVFLFYVLRMLRGRVLPLSIALGTLLVPLAVEKVNLARKNLTAEYVHFDDWPVLRGMSIPVEEKDQWASVLEALRQYTHEHPDATMVIYGTKAIYATLVPNLTNADPYYIYFQNHTIPPGLFAHREAFIRKVHPLIFTEDSRAKIGGREVSMNDAVHESGYVYQKNNMIENFGYTELVKIGSTGDALLRPGR
jgi:hypothetical protein